MHVTSGHIDVAPENHRTTPSVRPVADVGELVSKIMLLLNWMLGKLEMNRQKLRSRRLPREFMYPS
jgi:hypothetical protein